MQGLMYTGEASHEPERMDDDADMEGSRKGSLPSIKKHEAPKYSASDGQASYTSWRRIKHVQFPSAGFIYPAFGQLDVSVAHSEPIRAGRRHHRVSEAVVTKQPPAWTRGPEHPSQPFSELDATVPAAALWTHSGAPQLPSLPGLPPPPDMRFTLHSQGGGPPPVHPTPQGSGPTASSPGYHSQSGNNSLSSQSGEGSQLPYGQGGDRLWAYIRSLEVKIDRLQEEVGTLKAQLSAPR
ncbi:MAG: hypothetical protein Q9183_000989 [Haloplaca sp. 2 TL-2023]